MKKILLVGKALTTVPPLDQLTIKDIEYFAAPDLKTVQQVFEKNNNAIEIVVMGAGIDLEKRLEVVRYVFNTSNTTTVHMKDWETGPKALFHLSTESCRVCYVMISNSSRGLTEFTDFISPQSVKIGVICEKPSFIISHQVY